MALTRKLLKALGIDDEKIEQIITAHTETVDGLKEEIETQKTEASKATEYKTELDNIKKQLADSQKDDYKAKYEKEHSDFETYKTEIKNREEKEKKVSAYKALLKEIGIADKQADKIAKLKDYTAIKLDNNGAIENAEELKKNETSEWGEFIIKENIDITPPETPPRGNGGTLKMEDIEKMTPAEYIKARKEGKI